MAITTSCPTCASPCSVPTALQGDAVHCPRCFAVFTAPTSVAPRPPKPEPVLPASWETRERRRAFREYEAHHRDESEDRARRSPHGCRHCQDERTPAGLEVRCPSCKCTARPIPKSEITTAGWVVFAVLASFFLPLCWLGLLLTENYNVCAECGRRLP